MNPTEQSNQQEVVTVEQWEKNHQAITQAIADFIYTYARLPDHEEMAERTGMTSEEVGRHLEQFTYHPAYGEEIELMRMMSTEVLAMMGHLAARGDINAAKLYTQVVDQAYQKPPARPADEGPFGLFVINGVHMHDEFVKYLYAEELNEIEAILKAPANKPPEEVMEADSSVEARNRRWKEHHDKIIDAIKDHMRNRDRMPTITELVAETGLSRQTITKHLKEFTYHPVFRREIEQFRTLTNRILLMLLNKGRLGDVKAARLFFKVMKETFPKVEAPHGHTWYFLINQTRMDKAVIEQLSHEQKVIISTHFRNAIDRNFGPKSELHKAGHSASAAA